MPVVMVVVLVGDEARRAPESLNPCLAPCMSTSSDEIFTVRAVSASLSALPTSPLRYTYRFSYTQSVKLWARGDVMPKLGFREPPRMPEEVPRSPAKRGLV